MNEIKLIQTSINEGTNKKPSMLIFKLKRTKAIIEEAKSNIRLGELVNREMRQNPIKLIRLGSYSMYNLYITKNLILN